MSTQTLNARRLLCPLPVIRTQDQARQMPPGAVLEVIGTDPGLLHDIPAWCRVNGHRVLECRTEGHEYTVVLQIGG